MGNIDVTNPAILGSIWFGASCFVLSIIIAFTSKWLYVEPQLGWYVATSAAVISAIAIVALGRFNRCDATSIVGAVTAGALGFAFFATIAAPDLSALLDSNREPIEFTKQANESWSTTNVSSPVQTLPEPPLRALNQPTQVRVACGVLWICAYRRTDFKFPS